MGPDKDSAALPSPPPSLSTHPPLSLDSPSTSITEKCVRFLESFHGAVNTQSLKQIEEELSRHPDSGMIHSTHSLLHYKAASQSSDNTAVRLEHLNEAFKSSSRARELWPNSLFLSLLHAILHFELARDGPASYDAVIEECERILLIENPEEPGYEDGVPASWIEESKRDVQGVADNSRRHLVILGGQGRRGKWQWLVEDNSLLQVTVEFEALQRRKKGVVGRRLLDFASSLLDHPLGEKRKVKKLKKQVPSMSTMTRAKDFWNNKMSVENRRDLLRIGIEELKAYLDENKLGTAKEVLMEAIDFGKETKTWRFWVCPCCGHKSSDAKADNDHRLRHLGHLPESLVEIMPEEVPERAVKMVENGVWKPVELNSAVEIMEGRSAAADKGFEVFSIVDWPYVDDHDRAKMLTTIRTKLQLLMKVKCFPLSLLNALQRYITDSLENHMQKLVIKHHCLDQTLHSLCLLGLPELENFNLLLESLTSACPFHCLGEIKSEDDVKCFRWFWGCAKERVVFTRDYSGLLFDDRLLQEETLQTDDGNAVATSSTNAEDSGAGGDVFIDWLWTEGPRIGEQVKAWTNLTEACRNQRMEFCEISKAEAQLLRRMCKKKSQFLGYQKPFQNVEGLIFEEYTRREENPGPVRQSYAALLFNRWKELERKVDAEEDDNEEGSSSSFEMDVIWSILKEALTDLEIQMAIKNQKDHLARQLLRLDTILLAIAAAVERTALRIGLLCLFDYRFVMIPQLKSFMKARLEDLVNKDAAEKSRAATEALLAELSFDEKKSPDREKSKDKKKKKKKKKKDRSKAKSSEDCITGDTTEQQPTSLPVISSESAGQQHISQSGVVPISLDDVRFGSVNWAEISQSPDRRSNEKEKNEQQQSGRNDERMLEEALERQRQFEREAKEKWLAERNKDAGGTSAEPSGRNEDNVGSSEQQQQRQSGSAPLPFSGVSSRTPERNDVFQAKSESNEEQPSKAPEAEQNKNDGGTSAEASERNEDGVGSSKLQQRQSGSVPLPFSDGDSRTPEQKDVFQAKSESDEEQHSKAPEAEQKRNDPEPEIEVAVITDQLSQQELVAEQEHQAINLDEAFEWQWRVEKEAKEKWFAERNKTAGDQLSRQELEAEQQYLAEKLEEAWQCKWRVERDAKEQHSKLPEDDVFQVEYDAEEEEEEEYSEAPEAEQKRNDPEPEMGVAAITDQLSQQELEAVQEYQARKIDEALEWQWRVEKEAKEKWFAERNKKAGDQLSRQEWKAEQQYLAEKLEEAWQCKWRVEREAKEQHSKSPEDDVFQVEHDAEEEEEEFSESPEAEQNTNTGGSSAEPSEPKQLPWPFTGPHREITWKDVFQVEHDALDKEEEEYSESPEAEQNKNTGGTSAESSEPKQLPWPFTGPHREITWKDVFQVEHDALDKEEEEDRRKAKSSEDCITGYTTEQQPTSLPVISSGSTEQQHISQSGVVPFSLGDIQQSEAPEADEFDTSQR